MILRLNYAACEVAAFLAAVVVLAIAVPVFAAVFFVTLDEPQRRRA